MAIVQLLTRYRKFSTCEQAARSSFSIFYQIKKYSLLTTKCKLFSTWII